MSNTIRSNVRSGLATCLAIVCTIAFAVILFLYHDAVAQAQQIQSVPGAEITNSTPTASVLNVKSAVLDTPGKIQLQAKLGAPIKRKHCSAVSSFAKRGHRTCVTLHKGTRYTRYAQDRHKALHKILIKKAPADFKVFKWHGKWYLLSDGSRFNVGTAEFQPSQYILVKSFEPASYIFTVDYSVTNAIKVHVICDDGSTKDVLSPADQPGKASASAPISIMVNAVFEQDAEAQILQNVPQSVKDSVSEMAAKDAYDKLERSDALTCSEQMHDPFDPDAVNITSPDYLEVHVGATVVIYAQVKKTDASDVSFDFYLDVPAAGSLDSKKESTAIDGSPCPSGYLCYSTVYTAPKSVPGFDDIVYAVMQDKNGNILGGDYIMINMIPDDA